MVSNNINLIFFVIMELFDNLNEVKDALFDAPADVKESFNKVVDYFSKIVGDTHKSQPAAIFKAKDGSILYNNSSYKGNNNHIVDSLVEAMKRRNP